MSEEILQEEFDWTKLEQPNYIEIISQETLFKNFQIKTVLELIFEGSTVPFIARYKKEQTWNLDEDNIRNIIELKDKIEKLHKAKQTAINGIESLKKMTPELMDNIIKAKTLKEIEEIYKPYKSKKKTKAMIAIEKWFQVVANLIKLNKNFEIPLDLLEKYPKEEILQWSIHIISAEISSNSDLRADLLETLQKYANIISKIKWEKTLEKLNQKDKNQVSKFEIYFDFQTKISWLKPYQILALNRWEDLKILSIKIEKTQKTYDGLSLHYARILGVKLPFIDILEESFKNWYDTLFKSVENELRGILSEIWENDAIDTFKQNLANLLMTKPEYGKKILAIDPWFSAGCKIALLDQLGEPICFDKIFLHKKQESIIKLKDLIKKQKPWVIVIWNGTWVDETVEILNKLTQIEIFIVNESWASVYSASKIAKQEFPSLDSLDRGTISIWRRFIDPLSELVKVPVASIWVWMYQHDIPEKKLEEKLSQVVEDVVNDVWINVNSASSYVLNYISWIDKKSAKKIYTGRPYKSRAELKKQISEKAYEQSAWFLRVPESKNELDNTDIHPEQYELAQYIIKNNIKSWDFSSNKNILSKIYPNVSVTTIDFILDSYSNIWKEKRINSSHKKAIKKWDIDIKQGDIIEWVIRNVVAFGVFVDIWMKNDWLVHVSQIADKFVSDPKQEVEVWQNVKVKIMEINEKTWKIQLSMKQAL